MITLRDVGFTYAGAADAAVEHVSFVVERGAFALLTGPTGSGKTTLLRMLKPEVAPVGELRGGLEVSCRRIGFVFQDPDNQIVCDEVWHEMAFGLENEGVPEAEMRLRVAETCYFLGIEPWFRKRTSELSGGQRQVLALAATLAMRPELLLLDEPTAMLDPFAEKSFLALLFRANRELGITVVVATHRPESMANYATQRISLAGDGAAGSSGTADGPFAVCRGPRPSVPACDERPPVRASGLWFRYGREDDWVLRGAELSLCRGEARALLGGNGSGKTTLLGVIAGVLRARRGKVANTLGGSQAFLPQNPKALVSEESVGSELMAWAGASGYTEQDARTLLEELGAGGAGRLWERHPYDLSGGQQQILALTKLLLARPKLLMLDEPTKGLDDRARCVLAHALMRAQDAGATILLATHDLEFARAVCGSVSLLFDGQVTCTMDAGEFFSSAQFFGMAGRRGAALGGEP